MKDEKIQQKEVGGASKRYAVLVALIVILVAALAVTLLTIANQADAIEIMQEANRRERSSLDSISHQVITRTIRTTVSVDTESYTREIDSLRGALSTEQFKTKWIKESLGVEVRQDGDKYTLVRGAQIDSAMLLLSILRHKLKHANGRWVYEEGHTTYIVEDSASRQR